jgi:hypothetical protein
MPTTLEGLGLYGYHPDAQSNARGNPSNRVVYLAGCGESLEDGGVAKDD